MYTTDLAFTSIQVKDLETSQEFYSNIIGFQINDHVKQPDAVVFQNHSGSIFAIKKQLSNNIDNPGNGIALWFGIKTLESLINQAEEHGIALSNRSPTPFGDKIIIVDPDGYELTFFEQGEKN